MENGKESENVTHLEKFQFLINQLAERLCDGDFYVECELVDL